MSILRLVPPSPEIMKQLYEEYLRKGKPAGITFNQYLQVIGFTNPAEDTHGMDDGVVFHSAASSTGPALISVPNQVVQGQLRVMVLLADFGDRVGTTSVSHYEELLFSKNTHPTGSMRDFFDEVSLGKVDVVGEVHGWFRLPQTYTYYTNNSSGTAATYPRNAQRMAEDTVRAALDSGVVFDRNLDVLDSGSVTALFIVHAGVGAETQRDKTLQGNNIWSHKWVMRSSIRVADNLYADRYLTVPNDAKLGVCAHELGHLAFQWEDFYDPNYGEDGSAWDGSGDWDLMAGGSYNGNSKSPAHPIALHKSQHDWIELEDVRNSRHLVLDPFTDTFGKAYKLISPHYRANQYLILENRTRSGFDSYLPGEGLLVWRVDESKEMFAPQKPALKLVQADGRHDLERVGDRNAGDSGDPFPGSTNRIDLFDTGDISTSFPNGDDSGIVLKNIQRNLDTGRIALDVEFDGVPVTDEPVIPPVEPPTEPGVMQGESTPDLAIPDNAPVGVEDIINLTGEGTVLGITVAVDITHTYIGDLRVELVSPSGQSAVLHNKTGGNKANLLKSYTGADTTALQALTNTRAGGQWKLRVSDNARRDVGTLNRWKLVLDVAADSRVVHEKRTPALVVPDKDPTGVSDVIHVRHSGVVKTLGVSLKIAHTYIGDLRVELVGPGGERAVLHNQTGGNTQNLEASWSSADADALAALVGIAVRGDWVLRVSDHAGQDTGTLNEWSLDIDLSSDVLSVEKSEAPGLVIPDKDATGVSHHIAIDKTGTVQAIEIEVAITHTYIGDLRIELVAPSGELAILHNKTGGNQRNLLLQLDSVDSALLAGLVGQRINGNWILRVMDLEALDKGTLDSWSLKLVYAE